MNSMIAAVKYRGEFFWTEGTPIDGARFTSDEEIRKFITGELKKWECCVLLIPGNNPTQLWCMKAGTQPEKWSLDENCLEKCFEKLTGNIDFTPP